MGIQVSQHAYTLSRYRNSFFPHQICSQSLESVVCVGISIRNGRVQMATPRANLGNCPEGELNFRPPAIPMPSVPQTVFMLIMGIQVSQRAYRDLPITNRSAQLKTTRYKIDRSNLDINIISKKCASPSSLSSLL